LGPASWARRSSSLTGTRMRRPIWMLPIVPSLMRAHSARTDTQDYRDLINGQPCLDGAISVDRWPHSHIARHFRPSLSQSSSEADPAPTAKHARAACLASARISSVTAGFVFVEAAATPPPGGSAAAASAIRLAGAARSTLAALRSALRRERIGRTGFVGDGSIASVLDDLGRQFNVCQWEKSLMHPRRQRHARAGSATGFQPDNRWRSSAQPGR
jgi:hypothetical protein